MNKMVLPAADRVAGTGDDETLRLRGERDRYLAFAFSAADLLIELDQQGRIAHAAGAIAGMLHSDPDSLVGRPFAGFLESGDREVFDRLAARTGPDVRFGPYVLRLTPEGEATPGPPLVCNGCRLAGMGGHLFITARLWTPGDLPGALHAQGLGSVDDIVARAGECLRDLRADGQGVRLSLFRLGNLPALESRLDAAALDELFRTIAAWLREQSAGGDMAVRLANDRFGMVHADSVDIDALGRRIEAYARERDPDGIGLDIEGLTIDPGIDRLNEDEAGAALAWSLQRFGEIEDEAGVAGLTAGFRQQLEEASERMALVKKTIAENRFDVAYQPIVDLRDGQVSHYEALARFDRWIDDIPTQEFIGFAEETGLIAGFDLAMCQRVLTAFGKDAVGGAGLRVAVNLSGRSLDSARFRADLIALLKKHPRSRGQMMFEITESMAIRDPAGLNRFLQDLREAGHSIALDDFGTGAAAFEYLRSLEVDFVKIDGSYVLQSAESARGSRLFRAMATLCHDMGVATVAEMVEDEASLRFLQECRVDFGQGYLFGRPAPEPVDPEPERLLKLIRPKE